jgi:hypothetical protein
MTEALLAGVFSLIGAGGGAYLGAYLKKKGENLATHEDIGKLLDQVSAVTQTTKEIEAKISSDVWNEQKRWEMKREVLFEAAKRIVELDDGLVALDVLLRMDDPDGDQWAEHRCKATVGWRDTTKRFDETRVLIGIVCSKETAWEFENLGVFVGKVGAKLANKDTEIYKQSGKDLATHLFRARFAIRKELGIDGVPPQSK